MTKIAAAALLLLAISGSASACSTLAEQLAHDEPMIKAKLLALKPGDRLPGIRLCDNSTAFAGWRFIRVAKVQNSFQHVLLFQDGRSTQAIAWVESRGKEINVPVCPLGSRCDNLPEGATIISGDVYTFNAIKPEGELVILSYPPACW